MTGPRWFELKVTLGNLISMIVWIILAYAGYVELRTNHFNLDRDFRQHESYDDKRFADFATKETRAARDKEVDRVLADINNRLIRIESFLLDEYASKPRH